MTSDDELEARARNLRRWRRAKFSLLYLFAFSGFMLNPGSEAVNPLVPWLHFTVRWAHDFNFYGHLATMALVSVVFPSGNLNAYTFATQAVVMRPVPWPLGPGDPLIRTRVWYVVGPD